MCSYSQVPPMFDEMKKGLFNSCAEMLVFEREVISRGIYNNHVFQLILIFLIPMESFHYKLLGLYLQSVEDQVWSGSQEGDKEIKKIKTFQVRNKSFFLKILPITDGGE